MQRFSIIIPMLGEPRLFDDTLASVLRNRPANCEIIVVHESGYDDPYELADEIKLVPAKQTPSLVHYFGLGVGHATGELIGLIRPGIELSESWDAPIDESFESPKIASVSPVIVAQQKPAQVVTVGVKSALGYKRKLVGASNILSASKIRRLTAAGPTSWAAFYRRSALVHIPMESENLDGNYLDLDIALSLNGLGFKSTICSACVVSVQQPSLIQTEATRPHGKSAQRSYTRHASNPAQSKLVRWASVVVAELLTAPLSTGQLSHALQRIGAIGCLKQDRLFAQRIANQIAQRSRENKSLLPIAERAGQSTLASPRTSRRAA